MSHFDKIILWDIFMRHFHDTLWRDILVAFEELWCPKMTFVMVIMLIGWQYYCLLFNYTLMKLTHLPRPPQNINLIGELCNSLGKYSLTLFVRNSLGYWPSPTIWTHMTSGQGRDYKAILCLPTHGWIASSSSLWCITWPMQIKVKPNTRSLE